MSPGASPPSPTSGKKGKQAPRRRQRSNAQARSGVRKPRERACKAKRREPAATEGQGTATSKNGFTNGELDENAPGSGGGQAEEAVARDTWQLEGGENTGLGDLDLGLSNTAAGVSGRTQGVARYGAVPALNSLDSNLSEKSDGKSHGSGFHDFPVKIEEPWPEEAHHPIRQATYPGLAPKRTSSPVHENGNKAHKINWPDKIQKREDSELAESNLCPSNIDLEIFKVERLKSIAPQILFRDFLPIEMEAEVGECYLPKKSRQKVELKINHIQANTNACGFGYQGLQEDIPFPKQPGGSLNPTSDYNLVQGPQAKPKRIKQEPNQGFLTARDAEHAGLGFPVVYDYLRPMIAMLALQKPNIMAIIYQVSELLFEAMIDLGSVQHSNFHPWDDNDNALKRKYLEENLNTYAELFNESRLKVSDSRRTKFKRELGQVVPNGTYTKHKDEVQKFVYIRQHYPSLLALGAIHGAVEFCRIHMNEWPKEVLQIPPDASRTLDKLVELYKISKTAVLALCQLNNISQTMSNPEKKLNAQRTNHIAAKKKVERRMVMIKKVQKEPEEELSLVPVSQEVAQQCPVGEESGMGQSHLQRAPAHELKRPATRKRTAESLEPTNGCYKRRKHGSVHDVANSISEQFINTEKGRGKHSNSYTKPGTTKVVAGENINHQLETSSRAVFNCNAACTGVAKGQLEAADAWAVPNLSPGALPGQIFSEHDHPALNMPWVHDDLLTVNPSHILTKTHHDQDISTSQTMQNLGLNSIANSTSGEVGFGFINEGFSNWIQNYSNPSLPGIGAQQTFVPYHRYSGPPPGQEAVPVADPLNLFSFQDFDPDPSVPVLYANTLWDISEAAQDLERRVIDYDRQP